MYPNLLTAGISYIRGFSEKVHQGGGDHVRDYYSFVVNKNSNVDDFHVSVAIYIIFKNFIYTYLSCLICILSKFEEKNPPKTCHICDIVTGAINSALGHLLRGA